MQTEESGGRFRSKDKASTKTVATLSYPKHWLKPEDLLDFIETKQFTRRWEQLGLDIEGDHIALQLGIAASPRASPVIPGTHGIRKMRFAPPGWKQGKSGALRVLYVYFEGFGIVFLLLIYDKTELDDISEGVKKTLNQLVDEIEEELHRRRSLKMM